jgi:acyl-CoA synthetase (NDP forming)
MTGTPTTRAEARLVALLEPRSIAVVGASDRPGPSRNVVSNVLEGGYSGELYLVNPRRAVVAGRRAFPSLASLPAVCDLMVAAVNRGSTVEAVEEAVGLGVAAAVLLAAGFAETGAEGAALQARLAAQAGRIALLGPNCLGYVNLQAGAAPYSGPMPQQSEVGRVALVSNSGAFACTVSGAAAERGMRFSHVITTGNQVGLCTADFVRYLVACEVVDVVACYVEGFEDGRDLLSAFSAADAAGKRVVILKAGRTRAGGEAARSHTGALAGSSRLQESLFVDAGVLAARDAEEFLAMVQLQTRLGRRSNGGLGGAPRNGGVGIVTISGGERLLMADASEEAGLRLAVLGEQTEKELRAALPAFAVVSNPLDTTGAGIVEGDSAVHAEAVRLFAADPAVSVLVACQDAKNGWLQSSGSSQMFLDAIEAAQRAARQAGKPLVVVSPTSGAIDPRARVYMADNDIPFLAGLLPAIGALAKVLGQHPAERVPAERLGSSTGHTNRLSGAESFELLRRSGIEPWPYRLARSEGEAVSAAALLGYPVALKLDAPIPHRGEVDGVRLSLGDEEAVRAAYSELELLAGALGASDTAALVQPMAPHGLELFVGGMHDPQFGPVVLVGPGGSRVEDLASFAGALAPLDAAAARRLLDRAPLRWPAALDGGLEGDATGLAATLATTVAALSRLVAEQDVAVLDVNPLIVHPGGLAIIDAKIVSQGSQPASPESPAPAPPGSQPA